MKPILMILLVCAISWSSVARAQDYIEPGGAPYVLEPSNTKGPFYGQSEAELRARKFARGLANVVLCPAEIPNQIFQEAYKTSPVTGIVVGFFKGIAKGGSRLAIGTWEIFTFYFPGTNNYQPYIEPEVVFQEYLH
ncbi:exosortase system-associated protein, TIGR04073 family [bacterium]|nr:exosortase system-associated protein, TIGR04073 family [bacterium]